MKEVGQEEVENGNERRKVTESGRIPVPAQVCMFKATEMISGT